MVFTRARHNLAQQNGAGRPTPGDQFVTLCDGVVVAIAENRAEQLFFPDETCFISLGKDRRIDGAIDILKLRPALIGQFEPAAPEHQPLRFALIGIFQAELGERHRSQGRYVKPDEVKATLQHIGDFSETGCHIILEVAPQQQLFDEETGFRIMVVANLESAGEHRQGRKAHQQHGRARGCKAHNGEG